MKKYKKVWDKKEILADERIERVLHKDSNGKYHVVCKDGWKFTSTNSTTESGSIQELCNKVNTQLEENKITKLDLEDQLAHLYAKHDFLQGDEEGRKANFIEIEKLQKQIDEFQEPLQIKEQHIQTIITTTLPVDIKLRPYQERDFESIEKAFEEFKGVMYQLPTGGGKSVVISKFVEKHKSEPIIILAHKRKLITQMQQHLARVGITAGVLMGEVEENVDSDILIASIGTVSRDKRMEVLLTRTNKFKHIIIDEAHRTRTPSYEKLLDALMSVDESIKLFGVTATPYRVDKKGLDKYYQTLICSDDVVSLQKQGYLAGYKIFYTPIGEIDEEVTKTESDYVVQALSTYMRKEKFLDYLVESYKREADGLQTLIFCVDKAHARAVMVKYQENGYTRIAYIDSDTKEKEREEIFTGYERGEIQIIVCIETLTEGIDLPETKCIQLARPTKSLVLYLQMVGRGLRPKADGSDCIILDCGGSTQEHGAPASPKHWSLNSEIHPSNPGKKNKVVGKRKDGTFTEDEDEMEFCELVEMTPEEYLINISGNIDSAVEGNEKLEKDAVKLLFELGVEIMKKIHNTTHTPVVGNDFGSYLSLKFIEKPVWEETKRRNQEKKEDKEKYDNAKYSRQEFYYVKLEANISTKQKVSEISVSYDSEGYYRSWGQEKENSKERKGRFQSQSLQGKIADYLLDNYKHVQETMEEIHSILSSKTNISELKDAVAKFKDEQTMKLVAEELVSNTEIMLGETISLSSYFPNTFNYYSRYSDKKAIKLVFTKNKLLSVNEIEFFNKEGQSVHISKNVEKSKLLEILRQGNYLESKEKQNVSIN